MGEGASAFRAFVPKPLPPDPPLRWSGEVRELDEEANRALGRLDGATSVLPDTDLFLYAFQRKEALLSAQIEGTKGTLVDMLQAEVSITGTAPPDDMVEATNYLEAVRHCLHRMRQDGMPLSLRLIREAHAILLQSGRGSSRAPGEFRRGQVWLGGPSPREASFVPPPADEVPRCVDALEKYMHTRDDIPLLVRTGLVHAQFEMIHPFLDGNGRMGRLLVALMLCAEGVLAEPLLCISLPLKRHRSEYYDGLARVHSQGDWEGWVHFYLRAVRDAAVLAADTARRLFRMFEEHRVLIRAHGGHTANPLRLHSLMISRPALTARGVANELNLAYPTAAKTIRVLEGLGLARELTGRARDRIWGYGPYIDILAEGIAEEPG